MSASRSTPSTAQIVQATQAGLPLSARPYHAVAERLGLAPRRSWRACAACWRRGSSAGSAPCPTTTGLGYRANGMSVWDVPDERVSELGRRVGALPFVSHCYRRPRRPPLWPYNLFAMVHGRTRDEVEDKVARDRGAARRAGRGHDMLYSTRILKKTGLRLVERGARDVPPEPVHAGARCGRRRLRARRPPGPVVIWNLIRRCNLSCIHCYSLSCDIDFPGELSTDEVFAVMDDLKAFGVPVLILSGGEPLLRQDIFEISARAKAMGFYVGLSTNGTLIDRAMRRPHRRGRLRLRRHQPGRHRRRHDRFRRQPGAFDASLARHAPLPRARHQGRPALHHDRAQRRISCRRCSTWSTPRASTSSTSRTWSMPGAATATARTTPTRDHARAPWT